MPFIFGTVARSNKYFSREVENAMKQLAAEDPNMHLIDTVSYTHLFGVKIAINIKQIAVAETTINCVRVATLPLMTLLAERPTNMSNQ